MHGGTVGDGRGRSGSSRIPVGRWAGGVSGVSGGAASVGVGAAASCDRDRGWVAAAAGALRWLSGHACVVAGDGAAAAGVCGRCGRRGVVGSRGRARAPRGSVRLLEVPAATVRGWLRVMAGRLEPVRTRLLLVAHRAGVDIARAGGAGLPVARPAGRVGRGHRGGDRPVRAGRGPRPGDGVAGRGGVLGGSAAGAGVARAGWGRRCQHQSPLTRAGVDRKPREGPGPRRSRRGFSCTESRFLWHTRRRARSGRARARRHPQDGHDQDGVARRARAQQVALFRYQLICPALDPACRRKARGRVVRAIAAARPCRPVRRAAPLLPGHAGPLDPPLPRRRVRRVGPLDPAARQPDRHHGAGVGGGVEAGEPGAHRRAGRPDPARLARAGRRRNRRCCGCSTAAS